MNGRAYVPLCAGQPTVGTGCACLAPEQQVLAVEQPEPILDSKTSKLVQMRNLSRLLASLI